MAPFTYDGTLWYKTYPAVVCVHVYLCPNVNRFPFDATCFPCLSLVFRIRSSNKYIAGSTFYMSSGSPMERIAGRATSTMLRQCFCRLSNEVSSFPTPTTIAVETLLMRSSSSGLKESVYESSCAERPNLREFLSGPVETCRNCLNENDPLIIFFIDDRGAVSVARAF